MQDYYNILIAICQHVKFHKNKDKILCKLYIAIDIKLCYNNKRSQGAAATVPTPHERGVNYGQYNHINNTYCYIRDCKEHKKIVAHFADERL